MEAVLFVLGLVALVFGADILVRGASQLAIAAGITPLVVGLTVVAFGTSAPEMAVSVKASMAGDAGIAVGNVVGSNIFNVLFVLGLAAAVAPLSVSSQMIRVDVPLMIGVTLLAVFLCSDGVLSLLDGVILLGLLLTYVAGQVWMGRKQVSRERNEAIAAGEQQEMDVEGAKGWSGYAISAVRILFGLGLLVVGARWLVDSATTFARWLEVSDVVIGLTIVAAGTSLPECVTSVVASFRGERDIAVGNVVGSNVFNLLAVLGLSGVCAPQGVDIDRELLKFDFPVMVGVAIICLPIFITGKQVSRLEGILMFVAWVAYTGCLIWLQTA